MEIKKIDLDQPSTSEVADLPTSKKKSLTPLFILLAIILGVSSGAILKNLKSGSMGSGGSSSNIKSPGAEGSIKVGDTFGAKDESGFKDQAVGILEEGGLDGEGTHKLLREGGVSKTAYLTSSILDLSEFEGYKITIWGETFSAQKAGWLMDVGRVKVEELDPAPFEE